MKTNHCLVVLTLCALALAACSSDEDKNPAGGNVPDTTPPMVIAVSPPEDSTGMVPGTLITIEFSEAMDTSVDLLPHVLASHGSFTSLSWQGDSTIALSFDTLPLDTLIFVGLDTSLTDAQGNALAEPHVVYYETWSGK